MAEPVFICRGDDCEYYRLSQSLSHGSPLVTEDECIANMRENFRGEHIVSAWGDEPCGLVIAGLKQLYSREGAENA